LYALLETKRTDFMLEIMTEAENGEKIAHFFEINQDLIGRI
jgi:hypothetical protein